MLSIGILFALVTSSYENGAITGASLSGDNMITGLLMIVLAAIVLGGFFFVATQE